MVVLYHDNSLSFNHHHHIHFPVRILLSPITCIITPSSSPFSLIFSFSKFFIFLPLTLTLTLLSCLVLVMAEGGFEPYHVPQQSRRDKLRVVASNNPLPLQACAAGLVPVLDPAIISSDLITCAGPVGLHHQSNSLCTQTPNPAAGDAKEQGSNFMGYTGGGMIVAASSSPATNHLYVDPQSSVQLNPSSIQDISGSPFFYNPQNLRFLEQSFHGGEVMVYRPEPVSVGHGPNVNDHTDSSSNNNSNKCGQGLSLSLSSHHCQQTSLPLELNLQRYDSSMYSAKVVSTGGCFFPVAGDGSTSNELLSRNSVPLGPFTGYASILKGSRFLKPAQQLLEELCDMGRGVYGEKMVATDSILLDPSLECFSGTGSGTDDDPRSCRNGGENENRKKKSRLISMLNEVYRRYKQYYQQMQAVISSFETVAGVRNAAPFASFALKAMSKHFRCLKNAISEQLQLMIESRGHITNDKDAAPGFDNLGTGIHHCPRPPQNTAFVEHHQPIWRPQRGLPERAVTVLRSWLFEHFLHPYPTDTDKLMLAKQTGLSRNQVSNWFINARVRLWKPMVEEIHTLETRQAEKGSQREEQAGDGQNYDHPVPSSVPTIASENASSTPTKRCRELGGPKRTRSDFTVIPSGNENHVMNLAYENSSSYVPSSGGGGSGGVSLTLGLYQNNGNNNLGLADPYPVNAARRFGLDASGEGFGVITPNREFGREIVGGQLLHDFVG